MTDNQASEGDWEVTRSFRLSALRTASDVARLAAALQGLPGLVDITPNQANGKVRIRYRVTACDYQTIEHCLSAAGFPPVDNLWGRLKSSWYQNLDQNARENAAAPPPACCNKPPSRTKR